MEIKLQQHYIQKTSWGDVEGIDVTSDKDKKTIAYPFEFDKDNVRFKLYYPGCSDPEKVRTCSITEFLDDYKPKPPVGTYRKNTTIKVRVKYEFKHQHLAEILPVGFETEVITYLTDSIQLVPPVYTLRKVDNGKGKLEQMMVLFAPHRFIDAGTLDHLSFIGKDGNEYHDHTLYMALGHKPFGDIFDKI